MNVEHTELSRDLVIVGLALHTDPQRAATEIPAHWQRFMSEAIDRIPARSGEETLYSVYCDYESDHRGPYTMVLGRAVDPETPVPSGLRRVRVPAGRYAKFLASGDPARVIWQTWSYVNERWEGRPRRRYIADVE